MATRFILPYIDYSDEGSTLSVRVVAAITDLQITDLFNAITGVSLDGDQQSRLQVSTDKDGANTGPAANKAAQRENKYLVSFIEDVAGGKRGTFEIPCADTALLVANTDKIDLSAGAGLALKTQAESYILSTDGNAILVTSVQFVGRKL